MDTSQHLMDLNPSQLKSLYLHNLSYTVANSPFAKVYTLKYQELNNDKTITYPSTYYNGCKTCLRCNQINIPGLNIRISLSQDRLVYKCMNCKYRNTFIVETAKPVVVKLDQSGSLPITTHKPTKVEKPKKKKKTSLAAMLEQKKQQKSAVTLDLMEFMKQ